MMNREVACFKCHGTKRYPIGSDNPCVFCGASGRQPDPNEKPGSGVGSFGVLNSAIERAFPRWLCVAIASFCAVIAVAWLKEHEPFMPGWALAVAAAVASLVGYRTPRIIAMILSLGINIGIFVLFLLGLYFILALFVDGINLP